MSISFSFQGWIRKADIKEATDTQGNTVDVSEMDEQTIADKLNNGELFISLGDHLYNSHKTNIEMTDFSVER